MKRIIALLLCLCFALGGCAQSGTESHTKNDGSAKPDPSTGSTPVAAESFERLALGLAALPELPVLPDMTSGEGAEKLQAAIEQLQSRGEQIELKEEAAEPPAETPKE